MHQDRLSHVTTYCSIYGSVFVLEIEITSLHWGCPLFYSKVDEYLWVINQVHVQTLRTLYLC